MTQQKSVHEMAVGDEFEPLEFVVTPELNQQYLYAEEDFHPRYIESSSFGAPLVHPALLLNMSNDTRSPSYYLAPEVSALHARDETEFLQPARVGRRLRVTWKLAERYEKRGRRYYVVDILITDEDGTPIMRRRMHEILNVSGSPWR